MGVGGPRCSELEREFLRETRRSGRLVAADDVLRWTDLALLTVADAFLVTSLREGMALRYGFALSRE